MWARGLPRPTSPRSKLALKASKSQISSTILKPLWAWG
ncbi:MAG: hypothetical protein [Microvirus sp.]|nr:MAG: hypothetical protein [Microvirus sp.]